MDRAIGFYPTGREFESLRGCVKNYDYERDEVIRHKAKTKKPRTKRSDHKHQYTEKYVDDGFIAMTQKECSICGVTKIVKYHFNIYRK